MNDKEKARLLGAVLSSSFFYPREKEEGDRKGFGPCISWASHQEVLSGQNSSVAGQSSAGGKRKKQR